MCTLDHGRPWHDDQFASASLSSSRDLSRSRRVDAFLAPSVALDDRGFEDLALELGHLQAEPAGLGGQAPVVVAGAVRLPLPGALVSGGVGDLVGLKRRASRSMVR